MGENPFNRTFDRAVQGKYARVRGGSRTYEGWIERVHHGRGSVVLHDATAADGEELGSVFVRTANAIEILKPKKRVEFRRLDGLTPHPAHDGDFTPKDGVIRHAYRNQYAGSFPVVRESGEILNGHKRIAAARAAGLERHPVEVVDVTDSQARELFELAHGGEDTDKSAGGETNG